MTRVWSLLYLTFSKLQPLLLHRVVEVLHPVQDLRAVVEGDTSLTPPRPLQSLVFRFRRRVVKRSLYGQIPRTLTLCAQSLSANSAPLLPLPRQMALWSTKAPPPLLQTRVSPMANHTLTLSLLWTEPAITLRP